MRTTQSKFPHVSITIIHVSTAAYFVGHAFNTTQLHMSVHTCSQLKQHEQALEDVQEALTIRPNDATLQEQQAMIEDFLGRRSSSFSLLGSILHNPHLTTREQARM
jgi:hypothetical protein